MSSATSGTAPHFRDAHGIDLAAPPDPRPETSVDEVPNKDKADAKKGKKKPLPPRDKYKEEVIKLADGTPIEDTSQLQRNALMEATVDNLRKWALLKPAKYIDDVQDARNAAIMWSGVADAIRLRCNAMLEAKMAPMTAQPFEDAAAAAAKIADNHMAAVQAIQKRYGVSIEDGQTGINMGYFQPEPTA
jgi:hypothetical protein